MNPPVGVTDSVSMASEVYKYHRLHPELLQQLVSICRTMFPHNGVPDEFYEHVVRKLDDKAAQNQDLPRLLSEGVEALNFQTGSSWIGLSEEARLEALKRAEQTPFFQRLRWDSSFTSTVIRRSGTASDTRGRPMIRAAISIVASTTSIGSKERSLNLCHERLISMTILWR
jgi:hypothetical protein